MKTIHKYELKIQRVKLNEEYAPFNKFVQSPEDIVSIAQDICGDSAVEMFCVFLLDVKNKIIGYTLAGIGGPEICPIDIRSIFRAAIMVGASSIICAHNHPSSDTMASKEDIELTEKIKQAGMLLDVRLLDHVIVSSDSYSSFVGEGLLPAILRT